MWDLIEQDGIEDTFVLMRDEYLFIYCLAAADGLTCGEYVSRLVEQHLDALPEMRTFEKSFREAHARSAQRDKPVTGERNSR